MGQDIDPCDPWNIYDPFDPLPIATSDQELAEWLPKTEVTEFRIYYMELEVQRNISSCVHMNPSFPGLK